MTQTAASNNQFLCILASGLVATLGLASLVAMPNVGAVLEFW